MYYLEVLKSRHLQGEHDQCCNAPTQRVPQAAPPFLLRRFVHSFGERAAPGPGSRRWSGQQGQGQVIAVVQYRNGAANDFEVLGGGWTDTTAAAAN